MSSAPGDTRVEEFIAAEIAAQIAPLSEVYDHWANNINPDAPGIDEAEKAFHHTVSQMFDFVVRHGPEGIERLSLRDFRRFVISKCKQHLKATSKPSAIPPANPHG